MLLMILFGAFVILAGLTVPLGVAMGLAALAAIVVAGQAPPVIAVQRMVSGLDSFVLLAVPLFILAGGLMETGGVSARLINLVRVVVGHIRGGLGMVVVGAEMLFSGLSGSVAADVSAIGSLVIPSMVKAGYSPSQAVSIVSSSSAMGILVPPCIQMIIVASLTGSSVAALFIAGFVPAFVMAALLLALIYAQARVHGWPPDRRATWAEAGRALVQALIPLGMPVLIFGGIFSGATTPTEAGVLAVLYAAIVGLFIYKELTWADLGRTLIGSGVTTGAASLLLASSTAFAWLMATQNVPNMVLETMLAISSDPAVFLLLSVALFVVLGAVLEGIPAILILVPTLEPTVKAFGINQLHFDTLVVAATGVGLFLPPVGIGLLICAVIGKVEVTAVARTFLPYLAILLLGLAILVLVPDFTLVLPRLFGFL